MTDETTDASSTDATAEETAAPTYEQALAKHNAGEELTSADVNALERGTPPAGGSSDAAAAPADAGSSASSSDEEQEPGPDASAEEKQSYLDRLEDRVAHARERLLGGGGAAL